MYTTEPGLHLYDGQHICVPSKRRNSGLAYGAFAGIALDTPKNSGLSERNRRRLANDYFAHKHAKQSGADSKADLATVENLLGACHLLPPACI
ncbi:hypothetical protein [Marinobacterium aestuariivivens]|uniref:hypothetical protein n=1 Tax=Marinobacterium aestuariivivens TaxID=1698799 RepID=UPI0036D38A5F